MMPVSVERRLQRLEKAVMRLKQRQSELSRTGRLTSYLARRAVMRLDKLYSALKRVVG